MNKLQFYAAVSLAFVWIFTGLTSIFFAPEIGYDLLQKANIRGTLADVCVYGGALLDMLLGVWLLSNKQRMWCCRVQITIIAIYTVLLTLIEPAFWLHPFGPITKNLPIVVLILFVMTSNNK